MLSLINLDRESYNALLACEKNPDKAKELVDTETFEYLIRNKILVDDFEDTSYINKLSFTKRFACTERGSLSIVLCPTLGCNFACPYCYEHNLSSKSMPTKIQMKVIDFINQYEGKKKSVCLNWHGGEPLAAFETIKSFYTLFDKHSKLPLERSSMVSNGYLLSQEVCSFLNQRKLDYLQITIDGNKYTHDKTRVLKNGKGTYEQIIRNIDIAVECMPNCEIGVRTNIGKHNREEYPEIHELLSNRWKNKNVNIYHAFILNN
jgi:conserved domain protein (fragment)